MHGIRAVPLGFVLTLILSVVACSSYSVPVNGPTPGTWYSVECKRSQANCQAEAGNVCPNGYDVADSSGQSGNFAYWNQSSGFVVPTYTGTMLIRCRSKYERSPEQNARANAEEREQSRAFAAEREQRSRLEQDEMKAQRLVRANPQFPKLGSTPNECKVMCNRQGGKWTAKAIASESCSDYVCRVGGVPIYSVCLKEGKETISGANMYFEGGDVDAMSSKVEAIVGKPADRIDVKHGFRIWVWETTSPHVELSSYSTGVSVRYRL
jgi:hypothetical protein